MRVDLLGCSLIATTAIKGLAQGVLGVLSCTKREKKRWRDVEEDPMGRVPHRVS